MLQVYEEGGIEALRNVRDTAPARFLGALVAILPRQLEVDADVKVRVTSAVDTLISKLSMLSERDAAYGADREQAVKTIEHNPSSPVRQLFEKLEPMKEKA